MTYPSHLGQYLTANFPQATEAQCLATYSQEEGFGLRWDGSLGNAPTPDQVAAWQPSPVPAVAAVLAAREQIAAATITNLKAAAAVALVGMGMSEAEAYAAGTGLVVQHAALIQAYILAGGNTAAGQALIDAIEVSPPGWWGSDMLALFEAALV